LLLVLHDAYQLANTVCDVAYHTTACALQYLSNLDVRMVSFVFMNENLSWRLSFSISQNTRRTNGKAIAAQRIRDSSVSSTIGCLATDSFSIAMLSVINWSKAQPN
jgi:hypothetical protein